MSDGFVFHSNRASSVYEAALQPLGGRPYRQGDREIDLLYFCDYGGKQKPQVERIGFELVDRRLTVPIDNKKQMAELLRSFGINRPRVYFNPQDVPAIPDVLWYVKNPLASAAKDLACVPAQSVASVFREGDVIQEAITRLHLLNARKYTIRAYVLYYAGRAWLFSEGVLVVHAREYHEDDASPETQYLHAGYERQDSEVKMLKLSQHPLYLAVMESLKHTLGRAFKAFLTLLNQGAPNSYCLFGIDLLLEESLNAVLIEVNDRPNIAHTPQINSAVSVPLVQAMAALLMPTLEPGLPWPRPDFVLLAGGASG
ncbi:MAG: hypothetical protein KDI28_04760 [Pseudomonadales bacterium]|nr:hypothetical protein [Pseudomonadales bacterium]